MRTILRAQTKCCKNTVQARKYEGRGFLQHGKVLYQPYKVKFVKTK